MISIDLQSQRPLYEQVVDGFRNLISAGIMAPGDQLPSVRNLATQLTINPNTIQRAYRELEVLGYVYSAPGRGSFVADAQETAAIRREELFNDFDESSKKLLAMGVPAKELIERLTKGDNL